jgi:hypothetical protein
MKRAVTPASVPLSGFLSLSAVSWQTRASRPCFVPLPFLGSSLQSVPLVEIAYPSRGSLASLQSSTGVQKRMPRRLIAPGFTDARDEHVRLDPPTTMGSLSPSRSPSPGHPGCRATGPPRPASFTYFEASLPLRVRSPLSQVSLTQRAAALLGFFPSRVFSKQASESVPARARRLEHARSPVGSGTLPTGSEPSRPGEASPLPRKSGSTCSTDSSPLRDWPAPPLDGAPPLMTLVRRPRPPTWPTESLSHLLSGISSAEAPTLLRSLASSPTS